MTTNNIIRLLQPGALLLAIAIPACVATDVPDEAPPLATLAASAPANALGVTSWEIRSEGDAVRVIGHDADAGRRTELVMQQDAAAPADRVHVEVVFPEHGTFDVARGGGLDGASTTFLQQLGAALTADMAEHSVPVGTAAPQLYLQGEGHLAMGWSMFGYANNVDVNGWCQQGTRDSYQAYSSNGASCWVNFWSSQSPYDCRINLHYGISGWRTDTCNWFVYTNVP
jgi:hypothetical protein